MYVGTTYLLLGKHCNHMKSCTHVVVSMTRLALHSPSRHCVESGAPTRSPVGSGMASRHRKCYWATADENRLWSTWLDMVFYPSRPIGCISYATTHLVHARPTKFSRLETVDRRRQHIWPHIHLPACKEPILVQMWVSFASSRTDTRHVLPSLHMSTSLRSCRWHNNPS
jgi:hypothetical protein